jgi:hypothetical protein
MYARAKNEKTKYHRITTEKEYDDDDNKDNESEFGLKDDDVTVEKEVEMGNIRSRVESQQQKAK